MESKFECYFNYLYKLIDEHYSYCRGPWHPCLYSGFPQYIFWNDVILTFNCVYCVFYFEGTDEKIQEVLDSLLPLLEEYHAKREISIKREKKYGEQVLRLI